MVHTVTLRGVVRSLVLFIIAASLTWPAHRVGGNLGYCNEYPAAQWPDPSPLRQDWRREGSGSNDATVLPHNHRHVDTNFGLVGHLIVSTGTGCIPVSIQVLHGICGDTGDDRTIAGHPTYHHLKGGTVVWRNLSDSDG